MTASFTPIPWEALRAAPWKNGGGVTREIAAYPAGSDTSNFTWRVSVADIDAGGPFSTFPGIDRNLVLLSGKGMELVHDDGKVYRLDQPMDIARFAGETAISAKLFDGPTRDLNVMVRREHGSATVQALSAPADVNLAGTTVLLYCVHGDILVTLDGADPITLAPGATLPVDVALAKRCGIAGNGYVLFITITLRQEP
ncbi:HutD family protein [Pigmentiphaga aceris]|uniref:HutD family protein n=1 Tax=Pigmentiphaga aceris TaxID=1940612 RepID=A0A5C0AZP7_9BURK|nr:HutD family protein [Pigmentiphaga aceris]QEI07798.1 HutD family protein [Pigmentiphaga aceris]